MNDITLLQESPLYQQLINTIKLTEKIFSEMKKTHAACVGQITPLTSKDASAQLILERYFEKVDTEIHQINAELIWKNLQFMMRHKNHEIHYHLKKYDEEIIKTFNKLNNVLNDFYDYKVKFNWVISLLSIYYFPNLKKYYERSFKDFTIFVNKNCKYKEIRTY